MFNIYIYEKKKQKQEKIEKEKIKFDKYLLKKKSK